MLHFSHLKNEWHYMEKESKKVCMTDSLHHTYEHNIVNQLYSSKKIFWKGS